MPEDRPADLKHVFHGGLDSGKASGQFESRRGRCERFSQRVPPRWRRLVRWQTHCAECRIRL